MDQDAFRKTYRDSSECFCIFETSILSHRCGCSLADRFCIAEREGIECRSDAAQALCSDFLETLREKARFVLKIHHGTGPLAHSKALRLQVGGLRGLHALLHPGDPLPLLIRDIHKTVTACRDRFGDLEEIPYQEVIKQIAAFQDRKRTHPRRGPSNDD
ncbi:MAG: hypothetical protein KJ558_12425 [Gammaproteobacteria bacterium]|nr:hypothetical protein [Gammaproteobacteria bacterium]MBU1655608.1 hypothetical protein [Gammaproteobacteria bacterium]MBU1962280.1 hypothetical protein [Gammaproteobacteria bacterium]